MRTSKREKLFHGDGSIAVDPRKYPTLHRSLKRGLDRREEWRKVSELRNAGQNASADRLARKLLGVKGPEMDEETRKKLREYNHEHRGEIRERRKQERERKRRLLQKVQAHRR